MLVLFLHKGEGSSKDTNPCILAGVGSRAWADVTTTAVWGWSPAGTLRNRGLRVPPLQLLPHQLLHLFSLHLVTRTVRLHTTTRTIPPYNWRHQADDMYWRLCWSSTTSRHIVSFMVNVHNYLNTSVVMNQYYMQPHSQLKVNVITVWIHQLINQTRKPVQGIYHVINTLMRYRKWMTPSKNNHN